MVDGQGSEAPSARPRRSTTAYARGETDEFVQPTVIGDYRGMQDGDGLLSANFRADRVAPDPDGAARSGFRTASRGRARSGSPPRPA